MSEQEMEKILMDKLSSFREAMKKEADKVISDVYCDVLPYILADTQMNANIKANSALSAFLQGREIEGVDFSWKSSEVALKLYEVNKERIENAIIKAQAEKIVHLQELLDWQRGDR